MPPGMARRRPEPSARRPSFEHRAHPKGQRLLYTTRRRSRLLSSTSWTVAVFFCANGLKLQLVFPVQSVAPQPKGAVPLVIGVSREPQRRCWYSALLAGAGLRHSRLHPNCCSDLLARWRIARFLFCRRAAYSAPPPARRRCERLLREERLAVPAGVAVAISICSEMPPSRSQVAAPTPLRSRPGVMTLRERFYAVHSVEVSGETGRHHPRGRSR